MRRFKVRYVMLALVGAGLLAVPVAWVGAQDNPCTDKCSAKKERCAKVAQKKLDGCVARADKWKERRDKAADKAKDPEKAKEKVLLRYEKMKKACDKTNTGLTKRCEKAAERCEKACERRAKAKARKKAKKAE